MPPLSRVVTCGVKISNYKKMQRGWGTYLVVALPIALVVVVVAALVVVVVVVVVVAELQWWWWFGCGCCGCRFGLLR